MYRHKSVACHTFPDPFSVMQRFINRVFRISDKEHGWDSLRFPGKYMNQYYTRCKEEYKANAAIYKAFQAVQGASTIHWMAFVRSPLDNAIKILIYKQTICKCIVKTRY